MKLPQGSSRAGNKYHRTCKKVENISKLVTNIKDLNV